jgi:hypothetical protein
LTDVADQRLADLIGQQINGAAGRARAQIERQPQLADAAGIILLDQAVRIGLNRRLGFVVGDLDDLRADEHQHESRPDRAQAENQQREPERG